MSALDFLWEETALDKAVLAHSEEDVKTQLELLQNEKGSIDPDQTASALTLAIKHNRPTIVSLLLPYSPSLQYFIEDALNSGSKKILDLFLEQGWDINEQRERDGPPALGFHFKDPARTWLLEHGADPNAGFAHDTALSRAVLYGSIDDVATLLDHGADVNKGDVLSWAVLRETDAFEMVDFLLRHSAPPNRLWFDGLEPCWSIFGRKDGLGSPLHTAIRKDNAELVFKLLEYGADVDLPDSVGVTPKQLAKGVCNSAGASLLGSLPKSNL